MKRPRAERREKARALEKLGRAVDRAAAEQPGGAADRPLRVSTAALADRTAAAQGCPRCKGTVDLAGEAVEFRGGEQLRRFEIVCRRCETRRTVWIALDQRPGN